ncbi:DUF1203 domain-containing protein [Lacibacterium aquatile]|uniref:DUF1203 domain-containing protein n=1 Tax=Lacibacterium aquatile TaxID=1168082 RepID=A0ABW5DU25_9PROT
MSFRISGLPASPFTALFALSDTELSAQSAVRQVADSNPGYPCRIGLRDAEVGEEVILLNYEHQPADTPFRSRHAIYVAKNSVPVDLSVGEVPSLMRLRHLSLRGFRADGMMLAADLALDGAVEPVIEALFANPDVAYIHAHWAKQGCYAALIERA